MTKENGQDYTIKEATYYKDEGRGSSWEISTTDSTGFMLSTEHLPEGVEPKEGDTITLYTRNWSFIRGIDLNGVELFYKTDEELEREHEEAAAKREADQLAEFEENREDMDRRFDALPPEFQQRIQRRRDNNPDFRHRFEAYELFVCESAVAVINWAQDLVDNRNKYEDIWGDIESFWQDESLKEMAAYPSSYDEEQWERPEDDRDAAVRWWGVLNSKAYDYDFERASELIPGFNSVEHSGNTAGSATFLARVYFHQPENVIEVYGALAPLVGSEEYGDVPREPVEA